MLLISHLGSADQPKHLGADTVDSNAMDEERFELVLVEDLDLGY
jgi:hypothetical protein